MSDSSHIRSRRRVAEQNTHFAINFEHDPDQKLKGNLAYNSFSTVFNASASQLWNSAQEALASTYDVANNEETDNKDDFKHFEALDSLSICGSPFDRIHITMPSRDRTSEFRVTAKSYEMRTAASEVRSHPKHQALADSVQFNQLAKRIGHDLSQTCAKMETLAESAKKKRLYEERSQLEHLSGIVKEDIKNLNRQIAALQEFSRRKNGNLKDQNTGHSQLVVVGLQSKLASVSKDFQSVIEISTENMRAEKNRRDKFSNGMPMQNSLPSSSSGSNIKSRLLQDDQEHGSSSISLDMGTIEKYQTQQSMMAPDQSLQYAQARSNTMATIEGSISELGQIFTQLATLVSEQGEMITRIDSNVEETSLNIDLAHSELVRYLQNITKNRTLMLQIFGVLMVFFIVFVMFLT